MCIILAYSISSFISGFFFPPPVLFFFKWQQVVIKLILDIASSTWPAGMLSSLLRMLFWSELFRGYHDKHLVIAWDSKQPSFPYVVLSLHSKICIFLCPKQLAEYQKKKHNMFSVFVREIYQNGACLYKLGNTLTNKSISLYLLH